MVFFFGDINVGRKGWRWDFKRVGVTRTGEDWGCGWADHVCVKRGGLEEFIVFQYNPIELY